MKIDFQISNDGNYHQYCPKCHSVNIDQIPDEQKTIFICQDCKEISPRLIIIDPKIVWWIDESTKEYWHESVGVFIFNTKNEFLLFERLLFPFVFTIPAGHLDIGEDPVTAIKREIEEEVGIKINKVKLYSEEDLYGDQCRRGADNHKWHLFLARADSDINLKANDEGLKPGWYTFNEAMKKELSIPVKYYLDKFQSDFRNPDLLLPEA